MTQTFYRYLQVSIAFLIPLAIITSCNKENVLKEELNAEQIVEKLATDINFKNYVSALNLLTVHSIEPQSSKIISLAEFEGNFQKAVVEKNQASRKIISTFMGFEKEEYFWELREKINSNLAIILKSYNLKKLNSSQWVSLVSKQSKTSAVFVPNLKAFTVTFGEENSADKCHEIYNNCIDNANATFALEQLVCFAAGGLGWTGVGLLTYLACEAASNYHVKVMKRTCDTDFRYCNVK